MPHSETHYVEDWRFKYDDDGIFYFNKKLANGRGWRQDNYYFEPLYSNTYDEPLALYRSLLGHDPHLTTPSAVRAIYQGLQWFMEEKDTWFQNERFDTLKAELKALLEPGDNPTHPVILERHVYHRAIYTIKQRAATMKCGYCESARREPVATTDWWEQNTSANGAWECAFHQRLAIHEMRSRCYLCTKHSYYSEMVDFPHGDSSNGRVHPHCLDATTQWIICSAPNNTNGHYRRRDVRCECRTVIRNYSYQPNLVYRPEMPADKRALYMGMELETEFGNLRMDDFESWYDKQEPDFYYVKTDSSISNGYEVITHPFSPEWGMARDWSEWDELIAMGAHAYGESCGQHIHLSKDAFDSGHLWKLLQLHQRMADFAQMVGGRDSQRWGSFSKNKVMRKDIAKIAKEKGKGYYRYDRYMAVNLLPTHTIELRYPAGDITSHAIRKNIQWVWTLYNFTRELSVSNVKEGVLDDSGSLVWWIKEHKDVLPDLLTWVEKRLTIPKPFVPGGELHGPASREIFASIPGVDRQAPRVISGLDVPEWWSVPAGWVLSGSASGPGPANFWLLHTEEDVDVMGYEPELGGWMVDFDWDDEVVIYQANNGAQYYMEYFDGDCNDYNGDCNLEDPDDPESDWDCHCPSEGYHPYFITRR